MNSSARIGLFASLVDTFLSRTKEKGYIIIEVQGDADAYVQFTVHSGTVYGEVGSREWHEPERPLSPSAIHSLGSLGFTGGGPEKNYARDGLPGSAAELAALTDKLLVAAYDLSDEYLPVVREINLNDVTLPRAEPFTRDMIAAHLRNHGAHFLRDEDGDFRVDLVCPGDDEPVTIWFIAEGLGDTTYRISGMASHRPCPSDRAEAVQQCNTWNAEHRSPAAFVVDDNGSWRIVLATDFDLGRGVPRPLFDAMTERAVSGILAFWSELATAGASEASMTEDRDD